MKKILFAAVALIAFAACTNDYVVNKDKGSAIVFDKAFVENSTRADDYTANNIADFGVYGFITNNSGEGQIFNNQLVTKSGDAYVYSPAQYWVGGATYSFSALVPYNGEWDYTANNSKNGVISFDNAAAEANQDLLFAYAQRTTEDKITSAPEAVAFTFNHLLSRVKFSFTNGFGEGQNIELKVSNVHITNAYAEGTIALVNGELEQAWTPANNTLDVAFGDAGDDELGVNVKGTTEHFYLIPAVEATYNVTFDVEIIQAGVSVDTYNRTATVTLGMERGKSYDLQAVLTFQNTAEDNALYPIEFTVNKVEAWEDFTNADVTVPQHEVADAAELVAAVAEGGNIVLTQDIDLDTRANTIGLTITKDCVIDGAGHKITTAASRGIVVSGANDVTLKNFTLNAASSERGIQAQQSTKKLTIENVTAVAANYAVNLPSSAGAVEVAIKDCDLKGLNTVNVAAPGAVVNIENTVLRCEDNSAAEGYSVICVNKDAPGAVVNVKGGEVIISGTNANDTLGSCIQAEGTAINFDGTKGNTNVSVRSFAIPYSNGTFYTFETCEQALAKALEGETIVVTRNVTLDNAIKVKKTITLDLNGKTLKTTKEDEPVIWVSTDGQLTINGEGTVIAEDSDAVYAASTGKLVINGGNYFSPVSTVYAAGSAEVVINGGTHKVEGEWGQTYTLNLKGGSNASITVNGGSYYKYDPRNSSSEDPKANFVAEGKTVEQEGDWYIVK